MALLIWWLFKVSLHAVPLHQNAYLINYTYSTIGKKWRKTLLFNPFLQWLPKEKARVFPIVPLTIYSTAHYHPENDDDVLKIKTRNKQDTRWYTQQVLYTNQWLEYNSMLVYTVVLSAVNLLLLLIPDHLVGKEAFLLGEIMMSFCGGRRQIIRLETTNSTLLNGLLFV